MDLRAGLPRLDGAALKWIALASMLLDHFAAVCLRFWLMDTPGGAAKGWVILYTLLRGVGRVAFPIFCFLLVEGFVHTRDRKRYLLRLAGFAVVSELPFDLANFDRPVAWELQNIYLTLAIGLAVLLLLEGLRGRPLARAGALAAGCLVALLLRCDYGALGVLLIVAFYLTRESPPLRLALVGVLLVYETWSLFCMGLVALLPICCYKGERGRVAHPTFFYWFYPVHLLLLTLLRGAMG